MPYKSVRSLPVSVRNALPTPARKIFLEVYNKAWEEYASPSKRKTSASREETAARVAWAAVKKNYHKDEKTGKWEDK